MKRMALAATLIGAFALSAIAQTTPSSSPTTNSPTTAPTANAPTKAVPPASSGPSNSAVNSPNSPAVPGAPVAGANSFTEGQAKSRIEDQGFTLVSELDKDANGIWRGTATKSGNQHKVSLDFQGNVVAQ